MQDTFLPNGVYVAALTPLLANLSPDIDLLADHCGVLLKAGVQGLALMGTTGEANSLTVAERKILVEGLLERGVSEEKIMLGTGCCSYNDTIELTKHAMKNGIKSILLLPPFYYKQVDDTGLFEYFKRVLEECADEELEIYLYHFPKMTGIHFSQALLEKLIEQYPRNFVGMKDSGGDLSHMADICKFFPGWKLFAGTEKYLLDVLRMGGAGCISATANITVQKCVEVMQNWQDERADLLQEELTGQRNIFEGLPFIGILKQCMAELRNNPQWLNVRPPNGLVENLKLQEVLREMARLRVIGPN